MISNDLNYVSIQPMEHDGFSFDYVIQVSWDKNKKLIDVVMEYDILTDDDFYCTLYKKRNLTWMIRIKELLDIPITSKIFVDVVKVVDGVARCCVCTQQTPLKRFDFVLDERNYVKSMQYHAGGVFCFPYNCIQNDEVFSDCCVAKKLR